MIINLEPVKAHGHDMISTRMLKISGESILKQLELKKKAIVRINKKLTANRELLTNFTAAYLC